MIIHERTLSVLHEQRVAAASGSEQNAGGVRRHHQATTKQTNKYITMSVAQWDNEYARLARSASQMRTTGILTNEADVRNLKIGLSNLERDLDALPLQHSEIQRRRRLIQHLQQTSVGSESGSQQQQSRMAVAMQQQDEMIDQLASGVGRLKTQTAAIHDEATMHVNLITEMESGLDAAQAGLQDETRRAAALREDQSVWKLQLIVAALCVLLVLEIFMGLTP